MTNKLTKYGIISIITFAELIYFSYALFDKSNFLIHFGVILLLALLTYQSGRLKPFLIAYILSTVVALILLRLYYFEEIIMYLDDFWLHFINAETINASIFIVVTITYINFYLNVLIIKILRTFYIQLIKTIGLIIIVWTTYQTTNLLLTFIITILIIFIFLEAVTSLFSKLVSSENALQQIFRITRYIFFIAIIITGLSLSTEDPLGWLDELEWFEEDVPQPINQRMDAQGQITSQTNEFTYKGDTMLIVTTPYKSKLRGRAFDFYTSTDWRISTALSAESIEYQQEFDNRLNLLDAYNVPYEDYELFITHKAYSNLLYSTTNSYINAPDTFKSSASRFYESSTELDIEYEYTVNAVNIDYRTNEFRNMITSLQVVRSNEEYLQLPSDFNNDIKLLTLEITKNAESDYEKIIAVEQYLANNHEYTETPLQKPDYYDYVDFFLFESQEGFCSHYATSMVIMLRSIDIPARYVVGYVISEGEFDDRYYLEPGFEEFESQEDEIPTYYVNKDKSHAWVEVQFENYGWLEFEPTSRYYSNLAINSDNDLELVEPIVIEDIIGQDEEPTQDPSYLPYIFLVFPLIGVAYPVYKRLTLNNDEKIILVWKKITRKIYKKQKLRPGNETIREFFDRAWVNKGLANEIITIYEKTCYSKDTSTVTDLEKMKEFYKLV